MESRQLALIMAQPERYDRQIRLWGEGGQAALSRANVLVIGSTATATETLKNLVLPGIESFTIVDNALCSSTHAANFFVPETDSSASAECAARNLAELNPAVRSSYIHTDPATLLEEPIAAASFVSRYSLVIITQQGLGHIAFRRLVTAADAAGVPLMQVRSYGHLGLIRLQFPNGSAMVESDRDDKITPDLRLHAPFPTLIEASNEARLLLKDPDTASHVPFVLILLVALIDYRKENDDILPKNRADCGKLAERVKSLRPPGCAEEAENFAEALKSKHLFLCRTIAGELPYNVQQLFADSRSDPNLSEPPHKSELSHHGIDALPSPIRITSDVDVPPSPIHQNELATSNSTSSRSTCAARLRADSRTFWLNVAAVRAFYEREGALPLAGALPDMAADTKSYVALQRIFAAKAAEDARAVHSLALEIAERREFGADAAVPDASAIAAFCKTVRQARVLKSRGIMEEVKGGGKESGFAAAARDVGALDAANTNTAAAYYALFRAVDDFYREHCRLPDTEADTAVMRQLLNKVKEELGGVPAGLWSDETDEVVRCGGAEMHNVAALIGGIASQEAVKVITSQFVPLNNTLVFNCSNMTGFSFAP